MAQIVQRAVEELGWGATSGQEAPLSWTWVLASVMLVSVLEAPAWTSAMSLVLLALALLALVLLALVLLALVLLVLVLLVSVLSLALDNPRPRPHPRRLVGGTRADRFGQKWYCVVWHRPHNRLNC
jgi:hypothetical protein